MSEVYDMLLASLFHRHREPRVVSPIPEAARQVQKQADELRKMASDLRRVQESREREA